MENKISRLIFVAAFVLMQCVPLSVTAQGLFKRFHFDVDYHFNLGLSEKYEDVTLTRSDCNMKGNSLHFTGRYDITKKLSAGLGFGLDRYLNPDYNTFPVFATLRYAPVKSAYGAYLFTDFGYSIGTGKPDFDSVSGLLNFADFSSGALWNLGIGYTKMFKKHFGLNFQIAYNYKTFRNAYGITTGDYPEYTTEWFDGTRHSISFGMGIAF